jgi:GTPase SAR1 family protein
MTYNVLLIGSASVGKTSWINKIVNDLYDDNYTPSKKNTIHDIEYEDVKFKIVESTYDINLDQYDIDAVIIMCDFNGNDLEEVKNLKLKLNENYILNAKYQNISPVILAINKLDIDIEDEIDFELFSKEYNFHSFMGLSVKNNVDIFEPLDKIINIVNQKIAIVNSTTLNSFICELMSKIKNDNINEFKILYISLIYDTKYYQKKELHNFIYNINQLLLTNDLSEVLNYLINLYK